MPSLDCDAAGVSGGECMAEAVGDGLGDASTEPAGICLLLGVFVPDGTFILRLVPDHALSKRCEVQTA